MKSLKILETKHQYATASPDGIHWGLIDRVGEYVVPPDYVMIHQWKDGMLRLINKKSEVVVKEGRWINRYDGQVYFINSDGELINSKPYDYALDFSEGLAAIVRDGLWGFIDKNGNLAIECSFQKAYSFHSGLCAAKYDGKWGFIDQQGKWCIEPCYDSVQSFAFGLAVAEHSGSHFIINATGEVLTKTPSGYDWVVVKSEHIILYGTSSGDIGVRYYGFINIEGKILEEPLFYVESEYKFDLFEFSEGMLIVSNEEDLYGYLNTNGQLVIPCQYDFAKPYVDGYAQVMLNGKDYRIDKRGGLFEIIETKYPFDEVQPFHEGLAAARKGYKWGFIDREGEVIIDFIFHGHPANKEGLHSGTYLAELFPKFSCGLLPTIKSDGRQYRSGFISNMGQEVIPFQFLLVSGFVEV